MKSLNIKKVKLVKEYTLYIEWSETYRENVDSEVFISEYKVDFPFPAHEDFLETLAKLDVHLALIAEQIKVEPGTIESPDEIEDEALVFIKASQIVIGGEGESAGVTLVGKKYLRNGKVLNLVAPFLKFEDDDYEFLYELKIIIDELITETQEYIQGKRIAYKQQDLFTHAELV